MLPENKYGRCGTRATSRAHARRGATLILDFEPNAVHAGIYTALARGNVRGADPDWLKDLFGYAVVPDLVCYLQLSVKELIPRVLGTGKMNYWESGMDLGLGNDYYDSFIAYQKLLLREFDRMKGEYGFKVIDASRPVRRVAGELKRSVARIVDSEGSAGNPSPREVVRPEARVEAKPNVMPAVKETSKPAP